MRSLLLCGKFEANIDCGDALIDIQSVTAAGLPWELWELGTCDRENLEFIFQNSTCQQVVDHSRTIVYRR